VFPYAADVSLADSGHDLGRHAGPSGSAAGIQAGLADASYPADDVLVAKVMFAALVVQGSTIAGDLSSECSSTAA
jgi:hypothetical protein